MQQPVRRYAIALAALVAAVLLRWLLDPLMGDALPLVTLFGAVAAAAWVGGYRPAVIVAILGYLACNYLFIAPRRALGRSTCRTLVGLAAYVFTCALIIAIGEAMRLAQRRASEQAELMRVTLGSIGDAVITTDIEGRVVYLNAVAESLTGWTNAEALRPTARRRLPHRRRGDPAGAREPGDQGVAGERRRRARESRGAHRARTASSVPSTTAPRRSRTSSGASRDAC